MGQDELRLILAAEAAAGQQLEAAQREGQLLLAQAEERARHQVGAARDSRDALAQAVEERMLAEADEKVRRLTEGARAQALAMRERAAPKMDAAVELVLRCVLGTEGGDDR